MITFKTTVVITEKYSREKLKKDLQKMSLQELREFALNDSIVYENEIKKLIGLDDEDCKVHVKNVVVTENKKVKVKDED